MHKTTIICVYSISAGCEVKIRNLQHDSWVAIRYENDVLSGTT